MIWSSSRLVGITCSLLLMARAAGADVPGNVEKAAKPASRPQFVAPPSADVVRERVLQWVAQAAGNDHERLEQIGKVWVPADEPLSAEQLLALAIHSFSLADPATRAFVEACHLQRPTLLAPEAKVIERPDGTPFFRANLALFYGRYLAQRQMYEEALAVLEDIAIADVVDPAGLLFHKAVCQHHLLLKTEGLATISQLLERTGDVPVRYTTVATLMQYDLEALKDDSLDEVSRKMSDVERRLNLGRAGQKVQKKEDEIVASLDSIIKKIEEQQQQQQGKGGKGGANGNNNHRPAGPADDSVIKGSTAPGTVDPKKFAPGGEWGDLPARARARAKDLIAREFPAHYRTAIEEFTRKGANRPAAGK